MASRGVNKVILVGNLGKDPEVRYMPNGGAVANFTIATSETWKDAQSGEQKEKTEWHRIVMYRRLAEIAGEYLRKGSKVYLEGRLETRKWQNQQGQDQYTTEIVANEMQMLDGRGQGQNQGAGMGQPMTNSVPVGANPAMGGSAPMTHSTAPTQNNFAGQSAMAQPQQNSFANQHQPQGGYGAQNAQSAPQGGYQQTPPTTPHQAAPVPQSGGFSSGQQGGGFNKPAPAPQQGGYGNPQQAPIEPPIDFDDDIPF